jgi:hypothetical protein
MNFTRGGGTEDSHDILFEVIFRLPISVAKLWQILPRL